MSMIQRVPEALPMLATPIEVVASVAESPDAKIQSLLTLKRGSFLNLPQIASVANIELPIAKQVIEQKVASGAVRVAPVLSRSGHVLYTDQASPKSFKEHLALLWRVLARST